jgi:biotin-(acetyl-CoA carboxylase) ligase
MTNEPSVTTTSEVLKNILYALKIAKAFASADKHSGIRQLYEISELGEKTKKNIITPKWIKISAKSGQKIDAKDFREEFVLDKGKKILFDIAVASKETDGKKEWHTIGTITFDTSVVSDTCDHRLHFHHPVWRDDLRY